MDHYIPNSHPSIHTVALFFPFHFPSIPLFSHTIPCEFRVREKSLEEMFCQRIWPAKQYRKFSYNIYFFSPTLSRGEKGEGCLTVTYHSLVCVRVCVLCVRLRLCTHCPSRATVNLCTPVDFPGLFPRFTPLQSPHPHHPSPSAISLWSYVNHGI